VTVDVGSLIVGFVIGVFVMWLFFMATSTYESITITRKSDEWWKKKHPDIWEDVQKERNDAPKTETR
jgi:hypothetical protein